MAFEINMSQAFLLHLWKQLQEQLGIYTELSVLKCIFVIFQPRTNGIK